MRLSRQRAMNKKKFIIEEFEDEKTGMRICIDSDGNKHCFMSGTGGGVGDIYVNIPEIKIPPVDDSEKKRLIRIMEALRAENNWLWGTIQKALDDDRKHSAGYAIRQLQKRVKERQRA
jgi:hypothetical protein